MKKGYAVTLFLQPWGAFVFLWTMMFIIVFTDSLSWPAIPYLVKEFLVEESAVVATLGLLMAAFNLTKIAANAFGAFLGDKIDRSLLVNFSLLLFPASFMLLLFAKNHLWILGSYILFGIFYGVIMPPLNAMVSSSIPRTLRGTLFGVFNLSWILSQIPAPILGGLLSKAVSLRFPMAVSLVLSIVVFGIFTALKKTLKDISRPIQTDPVHEADVDRGPLTRVLLLLCLAQLSSGLANGVLSPVVTAYLMYVIGASPAEMGLAYSIGWALASALAQVPGGKLSDKLGYRRVIVVATLISSPLILLLPFSKSLEQFVMINTLSCLFGNMAAPAFSAYVVALMGRSLSKGFGLTSAFFSIGSIAGPILGSLLWTEFQPNYLPPFIASTAFFLLTLPFIIAIKKVNKTPKETL